MRSRAKKVGVLVLAALLLVPLLASPADARWRGGGRVAGGFFFGLGLGALLTAPWHARAYAYPPVYTYPTYSYPPPYSYPSYGYPSYAYPSYAYPSYAYPSYAYPGVSTYAYPGYSTYRYPTYAAPPPPAPASGGSLSTTTPTPEPVAPAAPGSESSVRNCQMVLVEGHNETRVLPSGQRLTTWVAPYYLQVCQ